MTRFALTAFAALAFTFPAAASTTFTAELETPVAETLRVSANHAVWVCESNACEAVLNRETATVRVCKQVVEEIGPVRAFGNARDTLTAEELSECNASLR